MPEIALQQSQVSKSQVTRPAEHVLEKAGPVNALDPITSYQQAFGNQAVQRMLQAKVIQAKLVVNPPDDEYEKEADKVADAVMRMPEPVVQRACPRCKEDEAVQTAPLAARITPLVQWQAVAEEEEEKAVRAKAADDGTLQQQEKEPEEDEPLQTRPTSGDSPESSVRDSSSFVPSIVHDVLGSPGHPLDETTHDFMRQRFGYNFSQVRVHSDIDAVKSAREVNANAYTVGHNIAFGSGQYVPGTHAGRRLIAHELTHVLQQSSRSNAPSFDLNNPSKQASEQPVSDSNQTSNPIQVSGATAPRLACQKATTGRQPNIDIQKTQQGDRTVITFGDESIPIAEGLAKTSEVEITLTWTSEKIEIDIIIPEDKQMLLKHSSSTSAALLKVSSQFELSITKKLKVPVSLYIEREGRFSSPIEFEEIDEFSGQRSQQETAPSINPPQKVAPKPPTSPLKTPEGSTSSSSISQIPDKVKKLLQHLAEERWDVDSLAAELTDDEMRGLSLSDRINIIRDMAGGYLVGDEDEETIVRLIATTPEADASGLINALRDQGSKLTQTLESVIDGEEYKKYHVALRDLYSKSLKAETLQAVKEKKEKAKVFPWADPGLINGFYNVRFHYDEIEFTKEGKISFVFWTSIFFVGLKSQKYEVDPYEMIAVLFLADENYEGAEKGRKVFMPAINLLNLYNKQFRQEMSLAVDTAMVVSGVGGIVGATTKLGRAIAILDTIVGATSITLVDFRSDIMKLKYGPQLLNAWDDFMFLYTIFTGYRIVKELPQVIKQLKEAYRLFKAESGNLLDPKIAAELEKQMADIAKKTDELEIEIKAEGTSSTPQNVEPSSTEPPKSTETTKPGPIETIKPIEPIKPASPAEAPKVENLPGTPPKSKATSMADTKTGSTKPPQELPLSPEDVKIAVSNLGKLKSMQQLLKRMEKANLTFLNLGVKSEEDLLKLAGTGPEAAIAELNKRIDTLGVIAQQTGVASNEAKIDFEAIEKSGGGGGPSSPIIGDAGVALSIEKVLKEGGEVLGGQIHLLVEVSPGHFVEVIPDLAALEKSGILKFIDAKKGMGAKLTDNQKIGYPIIRKNGCIPFGPNAEKALSRIGWKPGTRLSPTRVQIDQWLNL